MRTGFGVWGGDLGLVALRLAMTESVAVFAGARVGHWFWGSKTHCRNNLHALKLRWEIYDGAVCWGVGFCQCCFNGNEFGYCWIITFQVVLYLIGWDDFRVDAMDDSAGGWA